MDAYMYKQIVEEHKHLISLARFIVVTVDEVTAVDNSSHLFVHIYVVQNWIRVPLLICLQRFEGSLNDETITDLIVGSIAAEGGLITVLLQRS